MALRTGDFPSGTEAATSDRSVSKSPLKAPLKPEEYELARKREEQAALETELAECELRAANLRAELGAFERQYLHVVGSRYAELDSLKAELAERLAHEQPDDARAQEAAREARGQANETQSAAGEKAAQEPQAFEATPDLKRLYREVAKRIHPDLASDGDDRSKRELLMADANRAYECCDEAGLMRILAAYECSPEAVKGAGTAADLVRVIRSVTELRELSRSELFVLKSRLGEASIGGRDLFKEIVQKIDAQIALAKARLADSTREADTRRS
jgi:hypothetical protein